MLCMVTPDNGVPSTNNVWNSVWLTTTDTDKRTSESLRPASRMHTISDSSNGTPIPTGPGMAPPPTTCENSAANVAIAAALAPRARCGRRDEDCILLLSRFVTY